jgi:hypothetical protein
MQVKNVKKTYTLVYSFYTSLYLNANLFTFDFKDLHDENGKNTDSRR